MMQGALALAFVEIFRKASIALALSLSVCSFAQADATMTITSTGTNQSYLDNPDHCEIGRVTFDSGTESITALHNSVSLIDQGCGGADPSNGDFVQLLSGHLE
jgi:hypothetical protein